MASERITDATTLAASKCGYVEAPAGYGKTRLIADAVALCGDGKELILTHTHAGVNALRTHLRQAGVPPRSYHIETIAGWALRYCRAYPEASGIRRDLSIQNLDWDKVYQGALNVLQTPVRTVVERSYCGMYVDEYQDCTSNQHALIMGCAKLLPCRAVGDPLQGIFLFRNTILVTPEDMAASFEALPQLNTAWRWQDMPSLGQWLVEARRILRNGGELDLRANLPKCIRWVLLPETGAFDIQRNTCQDLIKSTPKKELLVAIYGPEEFNKERKLATALWGQYDIIEPITCRDLYETAVAIDCGTGKDRALTVLEFAQKALTRISTHLKAIKTAITKGRDIRAAGVGYPAQAEALAQVIERNDWDSILGALMSLRRVPGARAKRRELLDEMTRALKEVVGGDAESLQAAISQVRSRTSMIGRRISRYTLGRTVLIKGLQFDHSLLVDADSLDTNNLYVALTRASKTVTILSRSGLLTPSQNDSGSNKTNQLDLSLF